MTITRLKLPEYPPYSPDLAPHDFVLKMKWRRFFIDGDLLNAWGNDCAISNEKWYFENRAKRFSYASRSRSKTCQDIVLNHLLFQKVLKRRNEAIQRWIRSSIPTFTLNVNRWILSKKRGKKNARTGQGRQHQRDQKKQRPAAKRGFMNYVISPSSGTSFIVNNWIAKWVLY